MSFRFLAFALNIHKNGNSKGFNVHMIDYVAGQVSRYSTETTKSSTEKRFGKFWNLFFVSLINNDSILVELTRSLHNLEIQITMGLDRRGHILNCSS